MIGISMILELHAQIYKCTKVHEAWNVLKNVYDSINESRKLELEDQLEDLKYIEFKCMDEFLLKLDVMNSQFKGFSVDVEAPYLICIILKKCLSKPFQKFITNVHAQLVLPYLAK